jgi:hypothetical protein
MRLQTNGAVQFAPGQPLANVFAQNRLKGAQEIRQLKTAVEVAVVDGAQFHRQDSLSSRYALARK